MTFRVFTNDRGKEKGVFKYSAWQDIEAETEFAAQVKATVLGAKLKYRGAHGPVRAIHWPEYLQTPQEREWLEKHVHG